MHPGITTRAMGTANCDPSEQAAGNTPTCDPTMVVKSGIPCSGNLGSCPSSSPGRLAQRRQHCRVHRRQLDRKRGWGSGGFTSGTPGSSHWLPSYPHCICSGIARHRNGAHPNTQHWWTDIPTFPSGLYGNHLYRQSGGDTSVLNSRKIFWPIYHERDHTHHISAKGTRLEYTAELDPW